MGYFGKHYFFVLLVEHLTVNFVNLSRRDFVPELIALPSSVSHPLSVAPEPPLHQALSWALSALAKLVPWLLFLCCLLFVT